MIDQEQELILYRINLVVVVVVVVVVFLLWATGDFFQKTSQTPSFQVGSG